MVLIGATIYSGGKDHYVISAMNDPNFIWVLQEGVEVRIPVRNFAVYWACSLRSFQARRRSFLLLDGNGFCRIRSSFENRNFQRCPICSSAPVANVYKLIWMSADDLIRHLWTVHTYMTERTAFRLGVKAFIFVAGRK